jgi:hypothetical protein
MYGRRCNICDAPEPKGGRLCIDHCHKTGKIRGLLCHKCNRGIGFAKDDPNVLDAAAAYLRKYSTRANTEDTEAA